MRKFIARTRVIRYTLLFIAYTILCPSMSRIEHRQRRQRMYQRQHQQQSHSSHPSCLVLSHLSLSSFLRVTIILRNVVHLSLAISLNPSCPSQSLSSHCDSNDLNYSVVGKENKAPLWYTINSIMRLLPFHLIKHSFNGRSGGATKRLIQCTQQLSLRHRLLLLCRN